MKVTTKTLKTAKLCLQRAIRTRDNSNRNSLLYQFTRQMAHFCDLEALQQTDTKIRDTYLSRASMFDKIAELFRKEVVKNGA